MYRSSARRLLPALRWLPGRFSNQAPPVRFSNQAPPVRFSAAIAHQASFSAGAVSENAQNYKPDSTVRPTHHWREEEARVLMASLDHVPRLGWSDSAMIAGAKDVGVSPAIVGSFPRKEATLVEFFMDDCLQRLIDIIDTKEDLKSLIPSHRVAKLVRLRLEMQAPYISKWPRALSIQAEPLNISTSFKQRAMLVDEIWNAAGDDATDIDWYVKRTVLGGIYSATELYMLTDTSTEFQDTWAFLDGRVRDAFDLRKTVQEIKYLAEAVGAGARGPMQGFVKGIFQG